MKKTIAILCDYEQLYPEMINVGCGGSETWAIEISNEFSRQGYNVIIFSTFDKWIYNEFEVQYVPITMLDDILSYTKIDQLLITRIIHKHTLDILNKYDFKNKIYIICHDIYPSLIDSNSTFDNKLTYNRLVTEYPILYNSIKKFIVMSEFGKFTLQRDCQIPDELIEIIGNGINYSYFINNAPERDNDIFWSSRAERGLDILVNKILPILHKTYPDIKVIYSQYENTDVPENIKNNKYVNFIGRLSKYDLYKEMSKHKIWFYPNTYHETFCITAIEEALCNNELIFPFRHGSATVFDIFESNFLKNNDDFDNEEYLNNICEVIINRIQNYNSENRKIIRNSIKNYIKTTYSWENIVKQYTKLFNL